jgi:hypothetical protein
MRVNILNIFTDDVNSRPHVANLDHTRQAHPTKAMSNDIGTSSEFAVCGRASEYIALRVFRSFRVHS